MYIYEYDINVDCVWVCARARFVRAGTFDWYSIILFINSIDAGDLWQASPNAVEIVRSFHSKQKTNIRSSAIYTISLGPFESFFFSHLCIWICFHILVRFFIACLQRFTAGPRLFFPFLLAASYFYLRLFLFFFSLGIPSSHIVLISRCCSILPFFSLSRRVRNNLYYNLWVCVSLAWSESKREERVRMWVNGK